MIASPEPIPTSNKATPKRLPKKCWREEYIRILEQFEYPLLFRARITEPKDNFEKVTRQALVHDLEDAGLILAHQLYGTSIPDRITYFGRLELERLKSLRFWPRVRSSIGGAAIFAAGVVFRDLWPMVRAHFFSRFLN